MNFLIVSNYALNTLEITNKFCENKTKPKLGCKGKCHLSKQLKKQESQSNQDKETNKEVNVYQWYNSASKNIWKPLNSLTLNSKQTYIQKELSAFSKKLIKPPTV